MMYAKIRSDMMRAAGVVFLLVELLSLLLWILADATEMSDVQRLIGPLLVISIFLFVIGVVAVEITRNWDSEVQETITFTLILFFSNLAAFLSTLASWFFYYYILPDSGFLLAKSSPGFLLLLVVLGALFCAMGAKRLLLSTEELGVLLSRFRRFLVFGFFASYAMMPGIINWLAPWWIALLVFLVQIIIWAVLSLDTGTVPEDLKKRIELKIA